MLEVLHNKWCSFLKQQRSFKEQLDFWKNENSIFKPVWLPDQSHIEASNLRKIMDKVGLQKFTDFHKWSVDHCDDFWSYIIQELKIPFEEQPTNIRGNLQDNTHPQWLPSAKLNIAAACLQGEDEKIAIIVGDESGNRVSLSYAELRLKVQSVAHFFNSKYPKGTRVTIYMPLSLEASVIYLGLIYGGLVPVLVAESFSKEELYKRMSIAQSTTVVTIKDYQYNQKTIPLLDKIQGIDVSILQAEEVMAHRGSMSAIAVDRYTESTILFSSGTTGTPKAIPWTHLTPIKCASDGYLHHDIHPVDVVTWTTGMGWMMAPWLIFASLINSATLLLFKGAPTHPAFIDFMNQEKVTILGVIPSVVRSWRSQNIASFESIRLWTSTGEPSNFEDYLYLMSLTDYRSPIIEYCGGTEIGGGYITGTIVQPCMPSAFTTPALGVDFHLLDQNSWDTTEGEVFIIPPSLGLSEHLLNKSHDEEYHQDNPDYKGRITRKHGDRLAKVQTGDGFYYISKGRADDAMNIGGIKISPVEIENIIIELEAVQSCAVVSHSKDDAPELLYVFAVLNDTNINAVKEQINQSIKWRLNPLFRVHDLISIDTLPVTASGKVMRRVLRDML